MYLEDVKQVDDLTMSRGNKASLLNEGGNTAYKLSRIRLALIMQKVLIIHEFFRATYMIGPHDASKV